ncbi:unnamed protein product [Didymodactylos carnosus]|uniref:Uncharacterized protein n=1 Tax=Didymodactylos carnosus TaxID=1234261 RepID=A0A8S2F1P0_9BILA|nr:unnamed protein product [Didymodactylos carnosus]CAF4140507.1 unnamed protein product [Didymodactylos carnosus]
MRRFLVWLAGMIWPTVVVDCAVFRTLHEDKTDEEESLATTWKLGRLKFFFIVLVIEFIYTWLPTYFMPILTFFSVLCFINQNNLKFGQLTGMQGMSIGALRLDWNALTFVFPSPIFYPTWALCNIFVGFVVIFWMIVPILYYTNSWNAKVLPIFSQDVFTVNGSLFVYKAILNKMSYLNQTAYEVYGPIRVTPILFVNFCICFTAITSLIIHTVLYHGKYIKEQFFMSLDEAVNDVHGKLMSKFKEVPEYWYSILLIICVFGSVIVCHFGQLMPWYNLLLLLIINFLFLLPSGIIKSITAQDTDIGLLLSFIGSFLMKSDSIGNMTFRTYGYTMQRRSLVFLSCLKLGHYMKIPPRPMFLLLILSSIVGCIASYLTSYIMLKNINDLCFTFTWYCTNARFLSDVSDLWGIIGATNILKTYPFIEYFFLIGALIPIPPWLLSKKYPNINWLKYVHFPVMLATLTQIPPSRPGTIPSWLLIGFLFNFLFYKYANNWWHKYAYIFSAAMSAGVGMALIIIAFIPAFSHYWWGNPKEAINIDGCPYSTLPYTKQSG